MQKRIFVRSWPTLQPLVQHWARKSDNPPQTKKQPKYHTKKSHKQKNNPTPPSQKKTPNQTTSLFCSLWTSFSIILCCSGDYKDAWPKFDPTKMIRKEFAEVFCLVFSLYFLNSWFCWKRGRRPKQNEQFVKISTVSCQNFGYRLFCEKKGNTKQYSLLSVAKAERSKKYWIC